MKNELESRLARLKEPMQFKWRVQVKKKGGGGLCAPYIDARQVMDRLDEVFPGKWESRFKEVNGFMFCSIGIHTDAGVLWREDAGNRVEDDPSDNMYDQAGKAAASESFKRAAVAWGVGRFLYDTQMRPVNLNDRGFPVDNAGNSIWDLTKYFNDLDKKVPTSAPVKPEPQKEATQYPAPETNSPAIKQRLMPKQFDAMLMAISNGQISEVEAAMEKYDINLAQRTVLNKSIKDARKKTKSN